MENRNGLIVDLRVEPATGFGERDGALATLDQHTVGREGTTLGADAGYAVSQRIRRRVEEISGWTKTVACFRNTRFKGQVRTQLAAHLVAAAYNLLRMERLMAAPA